MLMIYTVEMEVDTARDAQDAKKFLDRDVELILGTGRATTRLSIRETTIVRKGNGTGEMITSDPEALRGVE
jgi:hypothetical protein